MNDQTKYGKVSIQLCTHTNTRVKLWMIFTIKLIRHLTHCS